MSKYQDFMSEQNPEFILEIHPSGLIPEIYQNEDTIGITLEQLEDLDNRFINNSPVGGE